MNLLNFNAENTLNKSFNISKTIIKFKSTTIPVPEMKIGLAADCPVGICNKKKDNSKCKPDSQGYWVCESGHSGDTCYEEYYSDGYCNPKSYAACSGNRRYPYCV